MNVTVQMDGTPVANLKVNNQQAAQYVISQLHRQKLGHKRIVISYAQNDSPDLEQLKAMVINILQVGFYYLLWFKGGQPSSNWLIK